MSRTLNASMLTDIAAQTAEEIQFIELAFSGLTTRMVTAAKDVDWNGLTWQAVGGILEVEAFSESSEDDSAGLRMTLSGVSQAILAQILGQNFRGRAAKVWYAHIDATTGLVIGGNAGPVLMFDGRMNESWDVNETHGDFGAGDVTIATRLSARINEISKIRGIRTNVTSHQNCGITGVTTDTFFSLVGSLVGRKVFWGSLAPGQDAPRVPSVGLPPTSPGGTGPTTNPPGTTPWGSNPNGPWPGYVPQGPPATPNIDPGRT